MVVRKLANWKETVVMLSPEICALIPARLSLLCLCRSWSAPLVKTSVSFPSYIVYLGSVALCCTSAYEMNFERSSTGKHIFGVYVTTKVSVVYV